MLRYRLFVAGAAGIATLALTACTAGTSPSPSKATPSLPQAGVPKVAQPLPSSVLSGDPCTDVLTPDQIKATLGSPVAPKPQTFNDFGPACSWTNTDASSSVQIVYDVITRKGLSGAYQSSESRSKVWREMSIDGFPAVVHASDRAYCQIFVGLADDMKIDVGGYISRAKIGQIDPCETIQAVAYTVTTSLKQKAGK